MRRAIIVGAGIGGLSAGIALGRAGWEVHIFERSSSPRELGFGVGLAPNAIAALRELGVGETILARAFEPTRGEIRRMDGAVLKRMEIPPGILGGRSWSPYVPSCTVRCSMPSAWRRSG